MDYGYIRVSTMGQNEDRQWLAMERVAVPQTQYLYGQTVRQGF